MTIIRLKMSKLKKLILKIYKYEDLKLEDKKYIKSVAKRYLNFII